MLTICLSVNSYLNPMKNSVANRSSGAEQSTKMDGKPSVEKSSASSSAAKKRISQNELLAGAIKRKRFVVPQSNIRGSFYWQKPLVEMVSCFLSEYVTMITRHIDEIFS